ncbi:MAG: hypothetical protein ACE5GE_12745, partial [Phycisphaerae bacterium]
MVLTVRDEDKGVMMQRSRISMALVGLVVLANPVLTWGVDRSEVQSAINTLKEAAPQVRLYRNSGRITGIYGQVISFGDTPEQAGEQFRVDRAAVLGARPQDLVAGGSLFEGQHTVPVMLDPDTGDFKFVLVYFSQERSGVPVFRSDLRLLVRNEPGYPVVLASSSLRNLGGFQVPAFRPLPGIGQAQVTALIPDLINFSEPQPVIWAGLEQPVAPRLAVTFRADNGAPQVGRHQDWVFVVDAATGEVLYQEDQIVLIDVQGNVSGMASTPGGSDNCESEVLTPLPYLEVALGAGTAFTDVNGNYTVTGTGATVVAGLTGQWFDTFNAAGFDELEGAPAATPADMVFNLDNLFEEVRAQVNGYVEANRIRDFVLQFNPTYPALSNVNFPVNVNRTDGVCPANAWYNGSSINFCSSAGGFPNTAYSSVVYHEYGHHLVSVGGSGQGQYGEGMGDVMSVLILDDSRIGIGFGGSCAGQLRNASNTLQYPCDSNVFGIHSCGRLISGCVWDTRQALRLTNPGTYIDILGNLAVNAILLH